jgi:nucleoside-diphosphate-sugar epimerase
MAGMKIAVGADETALGRACHAPSPPPVSVRTLAARAAEMAGAPPARIGRMPSPLLHLAGLVNPGAREMIEVRYQFEGPFILDSSAAQQAFGFSPTATDVALAETIRGIKAAS